MSEKKTITIVVQINDGKIESMTKTTAIVKDKASDEKKAGFKS